MTINNRKRSGKEGKFPFSKFILERFKKWTGVADENVEEALIDLTGDTYYEMRRLVSKVLERIEKMITDGAYPGYLDGKPLTEEQKKCIREIGNEELKVFLRVTITDAWNDILDKQKYGIDKLGLALEKYLIDKDAKDTKDGDAGIEQHGIKPKENI